MTARLGPYSPGRQARVRSPGQLLSSMSSALLEPVVNTTSEPRRPVSAATAARPASSTGAAAVGGDVPADLRFMPGVLGRRVDDREALP